MNNKYVLTKKDPSIFYLKSSGVTGYTVTDDIYEAKLFNTRDEAIDYNHHNLSGDFETKQIIIKIDEK